MINDTYEMAYVEVLEILNHLPQEDYNKIPKEKIEYYEKNKDRNYFFKFDEYFPIEEQRISKKAKAIIISLFKNYFATQIQQQKLNSILQENSKKIEIAKLKKYNPDNLFKNKETNIELLENSNDMVEHKESIITKIKNWFKRIVYQIIYIKINYYYLI